MAKITGALTGWKGKVGNLVFTMWKGVQVVKTRVIPENPRSVSQTINRVLFALFVAMFKTVVDELITIFWNPFAAAGKSGWGNILSANMKAQAGGVIDYEDVIIALGSLPGEDIITAIYTDTTGALVVTWEDTGAVGSSPTDLAKIFIYDKNRKLWYENTDVIARSAETDTLSIPEEVLAADLFAYLFFCESDLGLPTVDGVSNSFAYDVTAAV